MIIGGYSLDVYCDAGNEEPDMPKAPYHDFRDEGRASFYGRNEGEAKAAARQAGWKFGHDGRCFCKRHK